MARKSKVILVCDKHRGADVEAVGTLEIVIDGERRRLDLCAEHLSEARRLVRPWLRAAANSTNGTGGSGPGRSTSRSSASARRTSAALRAWAVANGYELPTRGRIPRAVHEAYEASQG